MRTLTTDIADARVIIVAAGDEVPEWLERICPRCNQRVWNTQPARITTEGTFHLGGCPTPGEVEATARMVRAFTQANEQKVEVPSC